MAEQPANIESQSIELRARGTVAVIPEANSVIAGTTEEVLTPRQLLKLFSSGFSFFVAGTNDGSIGALLPYILSTYKIGTSSVALIYVTTFLGWLIAALTNSHLPRYLNIGALLALGALLQVIPHALRAWTPPFGLFAFTFFLSGLGQAYQDSHANTFVSSVKGAHRWLGFIHAMYGLGLLVSPFVATSIATATAKWPLFYLFPLGLSFSNLILVLIAFRESVNLIKTAEVEGEEIGRRNMGVKREMTQMFRTRDLWIFCLFYFFYLGAATTSGGWIVEYLVKIRHGKLNEVGYVPAGAYSGTFLGRLFLAEPTHRFGEKKMLLIYVGVCFILQLIFWLVPNLMSSIVMFSLMGFFLGPSFAAGVSVASRTLPKNIQAASLGMIFVIAQAGGAIFPSLIGFIASKAGVQVLPPIVAGLLVAMGATWAFVPAKPAYSED